MKYSRFGLPICILIFLASANITSGQQRLGSDPHKHNHDIYKEIDQDYTKGRLNIDQKVLFKFYASSNPQKLPENYQLRASEPVKCGTPAVTDFQQNYEKLSASTVEEIELMTSATSHSSETYQSASGKFEIHYETSGSHAVPPADENGNDIPDYVEDVAAAADSSYRHQVQTLGYTDPITNGQSYEIRIRNLQSFYGDTWSEAGTTYIRIENDFAEDFPSNDHPDGDQIGAVNATVAHEFKHAIQYSANEWREETGLWLEMDATLMEEVVYDDVNDYYNYIESDDSIFNNPKESFYPGSYYHVTWALFFEEKFGPDFWPQVWQVIKNNSTISMVDALKQQLGGEEPYQRAYAESQLWHLASGQKYSSGDFGFEESAQYPSPNIAQESVGDNPLTMPDTLNNLSATYFEIQPSPFPGAIAVNLSKISNPQTAVAALGYFDDGTVEFITVSSSQQKSINYETNWRWDEINKLGIVAANGSYQLESQYGLALQSVNPQRVQVEQNYPNPFSDETTIRFSLTDRQNVQLEVFDVLGRKVATLIKDSLPEGIYTERFDGSNYASGIYFYRLNIGGNITTKQMTLVK